MNDDLASKLKYIKLDLDEIPEAITNFNPLNFSVSRLNNDKDHRVFKFIPIDKIEILLTPSLRSDSLKQKYSNALPLKEYLEPESADAEALERYTTFLKMIESLNVAEIENISSIQKNLEKNEPFKVKFAKDNLWQIYYSEATDRYFMLVCTNEKTFSEFFYLLKKKLEFDSKKTRIVPKVYVPINSMSYSEEILNRNEITDIENYLWLFSKNWCLVFEVFDKAEDLTIQIVGDTIVYDRVKSTYKVKLSNHDEALRFYKLLKALFILQTEIKDHYKFDTKINSKNELELYYGDTKLKFDMLTDFIKSEYIKCQNEIEKVNNEIGDRDLELEALREETAKKEEEYLAKQREISTYLEYKKTFFGKVKYFFKSSSEDNKASKKSKKKKRIEEEKQREETPKSSRISLEAINSQIKDKMYYTIEDLVTIFDILERCNKVNKNLKEDLNAIKLKNENLKLKVKNANLYIKEIDSHKKSIFDFWKFANKDEKLSLEMGDELENKHTETKMKKTFDIENDFEQLGIDVDRIQRKKLSNEETDAIFVAKTEALEGINLLREDNMDKAIIEDMLLDLKEDFQKTRVYLDTDSFDIFGNYEDDSRKVRYIGSKAHRENDKNKFKILNINKKIDVFDFTERLQGLRNYLEGAVPKVTALYDFSLYKVVPITEKINEKHFEVYNLDIERALEEYHDDGEGALNLIKLNYKEGLPLLYYSNIVMFDNLNKTLPEGMDVSKSVLVDCSRLDFKQVATNKFRTNNYFAEENNLIQPKTKDIFVYEYDVTLKSKIQQELDEKSEEEKKKLEEEIKAAAQREDADELSDDEDPIDNKKKKRKVKKEKV